jgi:hypothetical protein
MLDEGKHGNVALAAFKAAFRAAFIVTTFIVT